MIGISVCVVEVLNVTLGMQAGFEVNFGLVVNFYWNHLGISQRTRT